MRRVHLPLLPLPVLALVVAFSACSSPPASEPSTHVIPPAVALAPSGPAAAVRPAPAAPSGADAPSEEEVRAFQRPVPK